MDNMGNEKEEEKEETKYGTLDHMKARMQARLCEAMARKNSLPKKDKEGHKKEG